MNIVKILTHISILCLLLLFSCNKIPPIIHVDSMFTLLPDDYTDLKFENTLVDEADFNVFKYRNYYNGGGVAIGDINNDGLPDIYMTANHKSNKLFLNLGGLRFRDITGQARVRGSHNWSTGVCFVDINGDQLLDIYVCNSGNIKGDNRANELFVNQGIGNNGVPAFNEAAGEYGIDDQGFSTHAAFFDYDRDGDLDLYVLNNAFRPLGTFDLSKNLRNERDPHGGDRLYRNEFSIGSERKFTDVSDAAGILGSVIAFGLGVSVSDLNNDGWLDIYTANDFFERDYLYINNHDGSFTESLESMMRHVSLSSMGADIADLNNDGWLDVCATDMLPEDDYRLKTTFTYDTFDRSAKQIEWGYYHQLSQNVLQLNNGPDPQNKISFSEIGLLAGVEATDWSWGAIIVDLNNDGFKDIFVSNGIFRDVTDQDYMTYLMQKDNIRQIMQGDRVDFPELIRQMPSTKLRNYAFSNNGDLTFSNRAAEWGLDTLSFSNGVAYGDLDGDGDNDLVINNVDNPAFVYRNETDSLTANNYLRVKLVGKGMNSFAIGAKVTLKCANTGGKHLPWQTFVLEQMPMRGFQSSVDYVLTFGLGDHILVDTLIVAWPDGEYQVLEDVPVNQTITLKQENASQLIGPETGRWGESEKSSNRPVFSDITETFPLQFRHIENDFNDFRRETLIPHKLSTEGPTIAKGDVNGDGRDDLFFGGAKGQAGKLLIQTASGAFTSANEKLFHKAKISEDVGSAFFDADRDGDLDLYVVSGGNEYSRRAPALLDRLYLNDGRGNFTLAAKALPRFYASGSCVKPADFDGDGDPDLFVGSRSIPWKYGLTPTSYLLQNDGRGNFSIVTEAYAPELANAGMVTDAKWFDYDKDGKPDLVVVGEWMPVSIFKNNGDSLVNVTGKAGLEKTNGWWNCVVVEDINGDGYADLAAGNLGENSKVKASVAEPASIYISDFDRNGLIEQVLCFYKQGKSYPLPLRSDITRQLPYLREKFPKHADYATKQITDIFTEEQLKKTVIKKAYTFATSVFLGSKDGTFQMQPLPTEAQFSPVYAIMIKDLHANDSKYLLLAGNFYGINPQLGRYDASYGVLLAGNGSGSFRVVPIGSSGLSLTGQVRDIVVLPYRNNQEVIIFAKNDDRIQVLEFTAR